MQQKPLTRTLLAELAFVALMLLALIIVSIAGGLHAPALWTLATIVGAAYLIGRGASRGNWASLQRLGQSRSPASAAPADASDGAEMTVSEERLVVDKRPRARERVRLRKYVVTEQVTVTIPVRREHVRLEREPISETDPDAGLTELGQPVPDYSLTLLEEEIFVEKRVVPRERVTLEKHVVTENEHVSEVVRREEVEVEREQTGDG